MSSTALGKRLDRLGPVSGYVSVAETLERLRAQEAKRRATWTAAGNSGSPPPEPPMPFKLLSSDATCADAILWRRLAEGCARAAHSRAERASPFRDFRHISVLPDADLVHLLNKARQLAYQAELAAWQAVRSA